MLWTLLFLSLFFLLLRAWRNTFRVQINEISLTIREREATEIKQGEPLRILHLSDLHMENISISAEHVVAQTAHHEIDLIAITGDLLDRHRNIPRAVRYVETLMSLSPSIGTYVVFGNHDYLLPANKLAQLKTELERIGCTVLINQTVWVPSRLGKLQIIGIDNYGTGHSDLPKAYRHVEDDGIRLVLTHDPNVVLKMSEYSFDYLLSGHFHGGQIHWPKPFHLVKMGKLPRMNIVKGLHYHQGQPFYISEGLGQTGVNIRLRSRPEITLHSLGTSTGSTSASTGLSENRLDHYAEAAPTLALE